MKKQKFINFDDKKIVIKEEVKNGIKPSINQTLLNETLIEENNDPIDNDQFILNSKINNILTELVIVI